MAFASTIGVEDKKLLDQREILEETITLDLELIPFEEELMMR